MPLANDKVVYLEQPCRYAEADPKANVFCLKKVLYGLKQGVRNWYNALCKAMSKLGFRRLEVDHTVFVKEDGEKTVIMAVYVDDCLVTGSCTKAIHQFKLEINKKYSMTDLGMCLWLLGIKVACDTVSKTISLPQTAYINSILSHFNFNNLKPLSIPMDPNQSLGCSQCPTSLANITRMKNIPYHKAVGLLMYAALGTQPDIVFATSTMVQFLDNPAWIHWKAIKQIFCYLKGTRNFALVYGSKVKDLVGFVDADGASQEHRHAITGYVFMVDGGAVLWVSKKQELVTLSTTKAKYVAATHAAKEAVWLHQLISEMFSTLKKPTTLYSNNQSAIALAYGSQYHAHTKYINIQYHFIHYITNSGSIKLVYCPTNKQTTDVLTKALSSVKAKHFAVAMGLHLV